MKKKLDIAFLGPTGTYSHLVAEKYYGTGHNLTPMPTVLDVCSFVAGKPTRRGIVPIENSSGGAIYEMVDILLANEPRIFILEEMTLDVKLALLGRRGQKIKTLYSHFVPLEHCSAWIKKNLPGVDRKVVASTALAARMAFLEDNAAALANRELATLYHMDILRYPVQADIPNITTFLAIAGAPTRAQEPGKTTLAARLPNVPGSLCTFLEAFRSQNVNLSRITSRPIRGCPRQYAFLVDIEGSASAANVKRSLTLARRDAVSIRVVGSYPSFRNYR